MSIVKNTARQVIPAPIWNRLAALRPELLIASLFVNLLKPLSLLTRVNVVERLVPVGYLDFPGRKIYMRVDTRLQLQRLNACKKEPETVEWLRSQLREGDVFYDIGANVGAYSFVALALVNNQCKSYAFEPGFSTFSALCYTVILNGLDGKFIPLCLALDREPQAVTFTYSSILPGASEHAMHKVITENGKQQQGFSQILLSNTLDNLICTMVLNNPI